MLSRRRFLTVGLASAGAAAIVAACGSGAKPNAKTAAPADDFSARFARYTAADEPNGDLSKVVWPDYVTAAGPEVQRLYEFQVTHGDVMRYMPCFCGCFQEAGHRSVRDCYIKKVNADGSVVFDSMAPTCQICLGVTRDVMRMLDEGKTPRVIRAAIDRTYVRNIDYATPTPYPPA